MYHKFRALAIKFIRYAKGMDTSQMWGKVFDLSQKQLVKFDSFSIFVMPNDYIGESIIRNKSYEPHVTEIIRQKLQPGDVFLDLGANLGYFTMLASTIVGEDGFVLAFEPNPQNQQLIYASIRENQTQNIKIFPYAVSNVEDILRFTNVGSNGGVVTKHSTTQNHYMLVPAVIIDHILKDCDKVDLVKIDIEAHEPQALEGMKDLIARTRPTILTEYHPWAIKHNSPVPPENYLDQIQNLGYKISIILPNGNLKSTENNGQILAYYRSLNSETAHLDLLAEPINSLDERSSKTHIPNCEITSS